MYVLYINVKQLIPVWKQMNFQQNRKLHNVVSDKRVNVMSSKNWRMSEDTDTISLRELKDYFECPVCLTVPRKPPIWQCDKVSRKLYRKTFLTFDYQGHMICSTCRPQVVSCPECRGRYNTTGFRLYFAEKLLERVPVTCRYSDEGCLVAMVPGCNSQL